MSFMDENSRSGSKLRGCLSFSDIIRNALDRDYLLNRAAADLGALMWEREQLRREYRSDTHRLHELERLIPMQEAFALRKLRGDELSERLAQLELRVEVA